MQSHTTPVPSGPAFVHEEQLLAIGSWLLAGRMSYQQFAHKKCSVVGASFLPSVVMGLELGAKGLRAKS